MEYVQPVPDVGPVHSGKARETEALGEVREYAGTLLVNVEGLFPAAAGPQGQKKPTNWVIVRDGLAARVRCTNIRNRRFGNRSSSPD